MAFDLGNKESRGRLHAAKQTSRRRLDVFCKVRSEFLRDYVGSWYSEDGARWMTYVNKINQTARVYATFLAFTNPRVKVRSFDPKLWPFCRRYEVNINRVLANIDFKTTFQTGLLDAFFLMGVFNVRMADSGFVLTEDNVWVDPGKPWVDRVSPDDLILDMTARDIRAVRFIGHKYRVSYDAVMEREDFDPKVRRKVTPTSKHSDGQNNASEIASGAAVDDDELEPMVWLEDVYLPETRQLATLWPDEESVGPLKVTDRDDRRLGPYKVLGLGLVPDNVIPSSPAQNLKPLHDLSNRLYRKLSAQASRQKSVIAYPPGGEDDALRGKKIPDGGYVMFRDPKNLMPLSFPGVDGNTNAFFLAAQEVYNMLAGNERALAGLGSEAGTLGQEQMIESHATGMFGQMKAAVNECAGEIAREIGSLMFDDEYLTVESSMEAENTGYRVDSSWRPGERRGLKEHYDFSVEANSLSYRPPEVQVRQTMEYLQGLATVFPLVQAGVLDLQELTRMVAEAQNNPDLNKVVKGMREWMTGEAPADQHAATKAPVTSRETVRNNVSRGPQGMGMAGVLGQMMQGAGQATQGATVG